MARVVRLWHDGEHGCLGHAMSLRLKLWAQAAEQCTENKGNTDMSIEIDEKLAKRLQTEQTIWLTTVRADGTPVPTPVWFYWQEEGMLIFTQPGSHKLRNVAGNPRVALNFNTDQDGGSV